MIRRSFITLLFVLLLAVSLCGAAAAQDSAAEDTFYDLLDELEDDGLIGTTDGEATYYGDYEDAWAQIDYYQWITFQHADRFVFSADVSWASASTTPNNYAAGCGLVFNEGDGTVKRVYVPSLPGKGAAKIELVLENYLPIYLAYFNEGGSIVSKTYLSSYSRFSNLMLPLRVTSVQYTSKKDSTLTRTLYSNVTVDGNDGLFDFRVPADARPIKDVRGAKR